MNGLSSLRQETLYYNRHLLNFQNRVTGLFLFVCYTADDTKVQKKEMCLTSGCKIFN